MNFREVREVLDNITHRDWWTVMRQSYGTTEFRWGFNAKCSRTGEEQAWFGRWWDVTGMNEEQIVKTAFAALRMAIEHEAMEFFKYKGVAIFDPHTPLAALMAAQPPAPKEVDWYGGVRDDGSDYRVAG